MDYFNQESERLLFRKLTEKDIDNWADFFDNNDRLHFLGIDLTKDSKTLATEWIYKQLERYEEQGLGHLAVVEKVSGSFIGMGGILPRDLDGKVEFEIAYSIKTPFWKKGYGTEIARQMKLVGQTNKISTSFISIIHQENVDSIHVAIKNDMQILYETIYLGMPVFVYGDTKN